MNDDVRRRIESIAKVKASFRNIASTAEELGVILPGGLKDTLCDIENEYRALLDFSERKLRIAVAGKFSCGKSQFINSLVGKEIASVDSARTTCCKTIFTGDPSVNEVIISDSNGRTYSRDEYVQRSAKVSASREVFTVKLSDANWQDFEVIDTPGYDSIDEEDRLISEEAVADADVVFFLFDMGNGTIPKDSIEYLKKCVGSKQLFYLIANKADLKPDGARQTIMNSIAAECDRNGLKYECVLPYSSLMPWSNELLTKNETARANVLKLAQRLKNEAMDVVDKLVERASAIRAAKMAVELKAVDGRLNDFQNLVAEEFKSRLLEFLSKKQESCESRCEDLLEGIVSILQDSAVESTERRASSFVRWHELRGTGVFFSDWSVYLARPTIEYDLSDEDKTVLAQLLSSKFAECGFSDAGSMDMLIELRKECAIEAVDKYRIKDEDAPTDDAMFFYTAAIEHGDFCKTCDYESERRDNENSILANLYRVFPSAFAELIAEKMEKVGERIAFESMLKPMVNATFESAKSLADFNDSCAEVLGGTKRGDAYVVEALMAIDAVPSPITGTVSFNVATADEVEKGQVLGRVALEHSDAVVSIRAEKSGQVVLCVVDGDSVVQSSPLLMIISEEDANEKTDSDRVEGSGETPVDEVVSTVEGVVDGLLVEEGSVVKKGDRLLTLNVLNIQWPITATQSGRVGLKVKLGERVKPCSVLATIS